MNITTIIFVIGAVLTPGITSSVNADESSKSFVFGDIVASAHADDIYVFKRASDQFNADRQRSGLDFINVLANAKSSNLSQCIAAYYLGELRSVEAIGLLRKHITLQVDPLQIEMRFLVNVDNLHSPAFDALVKIGSRAIPALVQNLQEDDDLRVRELSLKALLLIEGDTDVVKMRLQKALESQTDSTKRGAVQSAIASLPDIKPEKP